MAASEPSRLLALCLLGRGFLFRRGLEVGLCPGTLWGGEVTELEELLPWLLHYHLNAN